VGAYFLSWGGTLTSTDENGSLKGKAARGTGEKTQPTSNNEKRIQIPLINFDDTQLNNRPLERLPKTGRVWARMTKRKKER